MAPAFDEAKFLQSIAELRTTRARDFTRSKWPMPDKERKAIALVAGVVNDETTEFYAGLYEFLSGYYPNDEKKVKAIIDTFRQEYASMLCGLSKDDVEDLQNQLQYI